MSSDSGSHGSVVIGGMPSVQMHSKCSCSGHSHSHAMGGAVTTPQLSKKVVNSHELRSDFIRHRRAHATSPFVANLLMAFFAVILLTDLVASIFYLHPNLYKKDSQFNHGLVFCFALLQLAMNWYKTSSVDSTYQLERSSGASVEQRGRELRSNWTYCLVCGQERPPRCTHCFHCNKCVLKRDHHCLLFSSCIAHYNMRYFCIFTFYLLYVCMIITIQTYDVIAEFHLYAIYEMSPNTWYMLVLCVPLWCVGLLFYGHWVAFTLIVLLQFNFVLLLVAIFYTGWLINLVLEGQTSYEALHDVRRYSGGWRANIRQVFGTVCPVVYLIIPINLTLPSNGLYWEQNMGDVSTI